MDAQILAYLAGLIAIITALARIIEKLVDGLLKKGKKKLNNPHPCALHEQRLDNIELDLRFIQKDIEQIKEDTRELKEDIREKL